MLHANLEGISLPKAMLGSAGQPTLKDGQYSVDLPKPF